MKTGKVEVYKDRKGEWRWRVIAPNGRILGDSGEGYKRRSAAVTGFNLCRYHAEWMDWGYVGEKPIWLGPSSMKPKTKTSDSALV